MKLISMLLSVIFIFSLGCARVRVEAPKEPIKVDISMRLDIYQHVQKDINEIENIVSGGKENTKAGGDSRLFDYFIASAYAQEGLSPEVQQAALRRKDRYGEISSLGQQGIIGENKSGLLEIRNTAGAGPQTKDLVSQENADRMLIYQEIARKNGTSVEDVQKLYAKRLQSDAPAGTPIEIINESSGAYEWKLK